jgi:hypothetical protein
MERTALDSASRVIPAALALREARRGLDERRLDEHDAASRGGRDRLHRGRPREVDAALYTGSDVRRLRRACSERARPARG